MIKVLSVDDHPLFREGIAGLVAVQADMSLVAEATNGREAVQQFRAHRPDVTLMDLQMPEMNGLDAMTTILSEFPDARIVVLTTYTGDVQVQRALKAGARGYLLKDTLHRGGTPRDHSCRACREKVDLRRSLVPARRARH